MWTPMMKFVTLVATLCIPVAIAAQTFSTLSKGVQEFVSVPDTRVALTHVRVVDGTGKPPLEDRWI